MNSITAVTDPANPKILEAYGSAGDRLDFDSVYHRDFITAQVPYYTGMARGQTVRATWENPRHIYHSEVVTVGTPGPIDIRIPRIEVVDAIGHTVKVYYTVRTAPGTAPIPSRTLLLHIDPYEFDLLAPTLSTDQKTLSVRYVGMVRGYTVRIRATGKTTWESDEREVQTGVTPTFTLPSNWIAENRGIDTRINYSVYKSGSGQRFMFSKVLRARIGEHVLPAPIIAAVKDPNNVTVPNGGSTPHTQLTVTGSAPKNQRVEILVDTVPNGSTAVSEQADWTLPIVVTQGAHSVTAKGLYENNPISTIAWKFTVTSPLVIDTSLMRLDGKKLIPAGNYGLQAREVLGNTSTHYPTGGVQPYTYVSANPAVASVDSAGKVTGLRNGSTTITVRDATSKTVSYSVQVTNVYRFLLNNTYLTPNQAVSWLRSVGAEMFDNSGNPIGWSIHAINFFDIMPIYGGLGLAYKRFVSLNLTYPTQYIVDRSLSSSGVEAGGNVLLSSLETARALAYIPT
ncbi:Ig-like domain-containing protein [Pseudomonas sp. ANT_J28]|uniref:Ig-like domain-containing protein n=1 Tax=Pseudomonas sp. ANT_J28 TaxID=2597352 RepID=UPI0011F2B8FF|nr:Ig-like domain-containing protein [Pseudomonas sp. ANT_J28]KAA0984638.1 Ig-like domain repeat protein [Pseudomonas sp. ANT_J28]